MLYVGRALMWVALSCGLVNCKLMWSYRRVVPGLGAVLVGLVILDGGFVILDFISPFPILPQIAARYVLTRALIMGIQIWWLIRICVTRRSGN